MTDFDENLDLPVEPPQGDNAAAMVGSPPAYDEFDAVNLRLAEQYEKLTDAVIDRGASNAFWNVAGAAIGGGLGQYGVSKHKKYIDNKYIYPSHKIARGVVDNELNLIKELGNIKKFDPSAENAQQEAIKKAREETLKKTEVKYRADNKILEGQTSNELTKFLETEEKALIAKEEKTALKELKSNYKRIVGSMDPKKTLGEKAKAEVVEWVGNIKNLMSTETIEGLEFPKDVGFTDKQAEKFASNLQTKIESVYPAVLDAKGQNHSTHFDRNIKAIIEREIAEAKLPKLSDNVMNVASEAFTKKVVATPNTEIDSIKTAIIKQYKDTKLLGWGGRVMAVIGAVVAGVVVGEVAYKLGHKDEEKKISTIRDNIESLNDIVHGYDKSGVDINLPSTNIGERLVERNSRQYEENNQKTV